MFSIIVRKSLSFPVVTRAMEGPFREACSPRFALQRRMPDEHLVHKPQTGKNACCPASALSRLDFRVASEGWPMALAVGDTIQRTNRVPHL